MVRSTIGDDAPTLSKRIRSFYTENFKALDQFDQAWYEVFYSKRDADWLTAYTWALVLDSLINARAAYCEVKGFTEPVNVFTQALISDIQYELDKDVL